MLTKKLEKGLIHIYTGDGKGKTTAAVGQGTRTSGAGFKVLMVQFLKGDDTGELHSIEKLSPDFQLIRFAKANKFYFQMTEVEKQQVKENVKVGLNTILQHLKEENYNLIIMDEIMAVLSNQIATVEEVLNLINNKPAHVELILTGRNAPQELVNVADYVTEMRMIKHPYEQGIFARKGIES